MIVSLQNQRNYALKNIDKQCVLLYFIHLAAYYILCLRRVAISPTRALPFAYAPNACRLLRRLPFPPAPRRWRLQVLAPSSPFDKGFYIIFFAEVWEPIPFYRARCWIFGSTICAGWSDDVILGFLGLKRSDLAILYSIFFATAGTFTGSMIAWLIGYKYGEGIVLKLGKPIHLTKKKLSKQNKVANN